MKSVAPFEPAVCVADLDRMMRFYCDVLGFSVYGVVDVAPEKSAPPGLAADGYTICRLETNDGQRFKLVQPNTAPAPAIERDYVLDRQGLAFATFLIEDLAGLIETFKAADVPLMGAGEKFEVRDGVFIAFARDPEGNCLEFVEYADITEYRPELG
jgi:catechol 2,3-dioxygenase-like lactoylglutathione lyase family enzyme